MKLKPLVEISATIGALAVGGFVTLGITGSFLPEPPEVVKSPDAIDIPWDDQSPDWDKENPDRTFSLPSTSSKQWVRYLTDDGAVGRFYPHDDPDNSQEFRVSVVVGANIKDGDFVDAGAIAIGRGISKKDPRELPGRKSRLHSVVMIGHDTASENEAPGMIAHGEFSPFKVTGIFSDTENEEGLPENVVGGFSFTDEDGLYIGSFYAEFLSIQPAPQP